MITIYGATDVGLARKVNQDRFSFEVLGETIAYAVLCDGMGGPAGGHVASETATRFMREVLDRDLKAGMTEQSLRSVMLSAAVGANSLVYDAARRDPALAGMGTTLVLVVFFEEHLYIVNAGDSRVYRIRGGAIEQLTKDHTVVQMLLDIGEITEEDAKDHPKRHFITRAVGVSPSLDADFLEFDFLPGDRILLCSDGLYNYIDSPTLPGQIETCLRAESVDPLIALANEAGGGDNITAVLAMRADKPPLREVIHDNITTTPASADGAEATSWTPSEVE